MKVMGIDPGYSESKPGGIAFCSTTEGWSVYGMPLCPIPKAQIGKRHLKQADLYALREIIASERPDRAVIEAQSVRPRQNVGTGAKSMIHYGTLIGLLAGMDIPLQHVFPQTWKRAMGLLGKGKWDSIGKATELIPSCAAAWQRHKDHGLAEAALIVKWSIDFEQSEIAGYMSGRRYNHPARRQAGYVHGIDASDPSG